MPPMTMGATLVELVDGDAEVEYERSAGALSRS